MANTRFWLIAVASCAWLMGGAHARAGQGLAGTTEGPVPAGIFAAKKVFVSNAGSDSGLFPHPFSGTPDRAYDEFYDAMIGWGRWQLVADPGEADLVLELQLLAPNGPSNPSKQNGAADPLPMLRLVIYDRKTHYVLWAFTESVDLAFVQRTHDRNFDSALGALVVDLKSLVGKAPGPKATS
jgi:hypothetical protein